MCVIPSLPENKIVGSYFRYSQYLCLFNKYAVRIWRDTLNRRTISNHNTMAPTFISSKYPRFLCNLKPYYYPTSDPEKPSNHLNYRI